jgi:hypothetical protein
VVAFHPEQHVVPQTKKDDMAGSSDIQSSPEMELIEMDPCNSEQGVATQSLETVVSEAPIPETPLEPTSTANAREEISALVSTFSNVDRSGSESPLLEIIEVRKVDRSAEGLQLTGERLLQSLKISVSNLVLGDIECLDRSPQTTSTISNRQTPATPDPAPSFPEIPPTSALNLQDHQDNEPTASAAAAHRPFQIGMEQESLAASPADSLGSTSTLKRSSSPCDDRAAKKAKLQHIPETSSRPIPDNIAPDDDIQLLSARPVGDMAVLQSGENESMLQLPRADSSTPPVEQPAPATAVNQYYNAEEWSNQEYAALAQACLDTFDFENFQRTYQKPLAEVQVVFAAVVLAPLLHQHEGSSRVQLRRKKEQNVTELLRQQQENDDRERAVERERLRTEIEADLRQQMHREGWIRPGMGQTASPEKEKQDNEANTPTPNGRGRRAAFTMSVELATDRLQAASSDLEKAKRAEQRRLNAQQRRAKQTGKGDKDSKGSKLGGSDDDLKKPYWKGYGKGKGM